MHWKCRMQRLHTLIQGPCKTLSGAERNGSTVLGKPSKGIGAAAAWCMDMSCTRDHIVAAANWPHHLFLSVNLLAQCLHHHWDGICQSVVQLPVHGDVAQHEGRSVRHPWLPCRTADKVTLCFCGMSSRETLRWQLHKLGWHSCTADTQGQGLQIKMAGLYVYRQPRCSSRLLSLT